MKYRYIGTYIEYTNEGRPLAPGDELTSTNLSRHLAHLKDEGKLLEVSPAKRASKPRKKTSKESN